MNPQESPTPPEIVTELNIRAVRDLDCVWHVSCPQWKYNSSGKNLTRIIALLVAEIENHIDQTELNEPLWYLSQKKLTETVLGIKDHAKAQKEKLGAIRRRKPMPPDDGTKTPRVHLWQAPT